MKLKQSLIIGIVATVIMSAFMYLLTFLGFPRMDGSIAMSTMFNMSLVGGWIIHLLIGVIFAAAYIYLFKPKVKFGNKWVKGLIYGVVIFIAAQIGFMVLGAIAPTEMPAPSEDVMPLMMAGGILGHVVFSLAVAMMYKDEQNNN